MSVKIHGKEYITVAERIASFRESHPEYIIKTKIMHMDDEKVVMRAVIASIDGVIATGHSEEVRSASAINRTSALENAETSAVGRALAFYGLAGTEIASADEVSQAIKQQGAQELIEYNALVRDNWHSVSEAKNYLEPKWGENENQPHITDARLVMNELGDDIHRKLWRAPTKGGCFTTQERTLLKQPERAMEIFGVEAL